MRFVDIKGNVWLYQRGDHAWGLKVLSRSNAIVQAFLSNGLCPRDPSWRGKSRPVLFEVGRQLMISCGLFHKCNASKGLRPRFRVVLAVHALSASLVLPEEPGGR